MPEIVHQACPAQRIGRFQLLRHALGLRHLHYGLFHHLLCGLLDLRQMLRQLAAGLEVGVKHPAALFQVCSPQLRVLAQMHLRRLRHQQVRHLKAILHPVSDLHAVRSFHGVFRVVLCGHHICFFHGLQKIDPAEPA